MIDACEAISRASSPRNRTFEAIIDASEAMARA